MGIADRSSVSRPSTTVIELEATASAVRETARAMATWRDSSFLSSSR